VSVKVLFIGGPLDGMTRTVEKERRYVIASDRGKPDVCYTVHPVNVFGVVVHVATLGPTVESRVLWDRLASTTAKGLLS
jgi:hypothetical protein